MGFGTKACIVFCYLNAACVFLVGYLFDIGITSMAVTSATRHWDSAQKARSCRRASVLYLIVGIALTVKSIREDRKVAAAELMEREARLAEYEGILDMQESTPLLERRQHCRGSDHNAASAASATREAYGTTHVM